MRIPSKLADRSTFVEDVITKCLASREDRCASYKTLKQYYLYGREGSPDTAENVFGTINKIWSHLDQVVSFLYSQDTTRFSVEIGKSVAEAELLKCPALNEAVNDHWHTSDTDIRYGDALLWSLVYGSMFIKPRWHTDHIIPDVVEPHNVGVWREDVQGLENQEAFVHLYRIPESQLEYELTISGHKDVKAIMKEAVPNLVGNEESDVSQPINRITTSSAEPSVTGEVDQALGPNLTYSPKMPIPMVRMHELYVYDDEIKDYRVFTIANPFVLVYDRPMGKMYLPNEMPIVQLCPYPVHDYFFGLSLTERLIGLQMMRNTRWDQVQHMMEMQARPSSFGTGQYGTADELQDALDSPNGLVLGEQGATMEKQVVTIPDDLFAEISYIDSQFDETDGTTPIMSGKGEQGVRSEGHASQLLRVGSSRAKRRALVVEDSLEELATMYLKILQKYSDAKYRAESAGREPGLIFVAAQFTDDFMVKVDAHSNSPLFMQDLTQMAQLLFKAKAIDREELIEMLAVPMKDLLKLKLKTKIEPAEARQAQQERAAEAAGQKVTRLAGRK